MSRPRVTVGIPFHDEARFLDPAVRSVLAQTMGDFELLLVDDGSSDRSLEIARSLRDPRITVFSDGVRRGLGARLNEIVRRARTDLVARMDADDVSHPERLARQLELLDREPSCDAVGTDAVLVDENEEPFAIAALPDRPTSAVDALRRGSLLHATMVARRTWLVENPYDERLRRAEDRDLWCRTIGRAELRVLSEVLYVVRVRPHDASFVDEYVLAQTENRRLFLRYGPRTLGVLGTAKACLETYAKAAIMRAADRVSLVDRVVARRGGAVTPDAARRAEEALSAARPVQRA